MVASGVSELSSRISIYVLYVLRSAISFGRTFA